MRFEHEGMFLWLQPCESMVGEEAGSYITFAFGGEPAAASYGFGVRYRVNRGPIKKVAADAMRRSCGARYFRASLPGDVFRAGDTLEWAAFCQCAGRQVPS